MICSQKSVRNRNFFENAGHVSFSFCQTGSAETLTKPCKTSPQGTSIKRPAIYWDHAVSWGGGVWVSVSDIGRVGKKMVLRRIPVYFLSTIFHDLKPKLASYPRKVQIFPINQELSYEVLVGKIILKAVLISS